jgi:IstB-like ATP binding protein
VLASGGFLTEARNIVLLGPPGAGKTHQATGLGIAAAGHGHRVLFATATDWVTRLTDAHWQGRLPAVVSFFESVVRDYSKDHAMAVAASTRHGHGSRTPPWRTQLGRTLGLPIAA